MDTQGARVLVTGGATGIGRATAALLGERGARVAICGRTETRLRETAAAIGALPLCCDVSQEDEVERTVAAAAAALGGLDALVNNAGCGSFAPLVEASAADFRRTFETNALGAFLVGRACARLFTRERRGTIVNVGSTAARRGFAGGSAYCASKFALSALTECWRAELRGSNVRVMQVDPSEVQNDFGTHAGRAPRTAVNPRKLVSEDIARVIVALLELDDRAFSPGLEVWATNPG
ncbi:MAG: SDR family oxidoreductase [Planctomycetes bacterium]|nr:SDR family oxidoreductase [Planctomycetota bacterium]